MRQYLEFEKPVAELEAKIEELRLMTAPGEINIADEVAKLSAKADGQLKTIYSRLTPWQKTQVARHAERPKAVSVINTLIEDLPEPLGPTMPIFSPAATVKESPS